MLVKVRNSKRGERCLLGCQLFRGLGNSSLDNLECLLGLILKRLSLLLDRGAEGLGARREVALEVGAVGEARGVLGDELVESRLQIALLETFVARRGESATKCLRAPWTQERSR